MEITRGYDILTDAEGQVAIFQTHQAWRKKESYVKQLKGH